jgi:hypothetical protein
MWKKPNSLGGDNLPSFPRLEIEGIFAWYDFWVGAYYDRKDRWLYLMIPMLGVRVRLIKSAVSVSE